MSDTEKNKPTVEQAAWVIDKLTDHFQQGGTFGYLVHSRMGYNGKGDYETLQVAGGLYLSNVAFEHNSEYPFHHSDAMSPCGRHEYRFWVEVVTTDPDHAPADNPDHVSIASYCVMCVNERLIEELKAVTREVKLQ